MTRKRPQGWIERIAERDQFVCHLCFELVEMDLCHPDPMAPELDHLIPRSRFGPTLPWNLALSHRVCNTWRGDLDVHLARELRIGWLPGDTRSRPCRYDQAKRCECLSACPIMEHPNQGTQEG